MLEQNSEEVFDLFDVGPFLTKKEKQSLRSKKWKENNKERSIVLNMRWYEKNKDVTIIRSKKWAEENKERNQYHRWKIKLKKKYGLTPEGYIRLLELQNYKCKICGIPHHENNRKLAVDHCHKTNKIRGLLCKKCNGGLGIFDDKIESLEKAIDYLKEYNYGQ